MIGSCLRYRLCVSSILAACVGLDLLEIQSIFALYFIICSRFFFFFMFLNPICRMNVVSYYTLLNTEERKLANWPLTRTVLRRARLLVIVCLEFKSRVYSEKKRSDMTCLLMKIVIKECSVTFSEKI